ncbi:MAG: hypothetical protein AAFP20_10425, partial [Cyanobacteria bacterium J06614_10]
VGRTMGLRILSLRVLVYGDCVHTAHSDRMLSRTACPAVRGRSLFTTNDSPGANPDKISPGDGTDAIAEHSVYSATHCNAGAHGSRRRAGIVLYSAATG